MKPLRSLAALALAVFLSGCVLPLVALAQQSRERNRPRTPRDAPPATTPVRNLAFICEAPIAANTPVDTCPGDKQRYDIPTPAELVKWCPSGATSNQQCDSAALRWQKFGVLDDAQRIDTCNAPELVPGTRIPYPWTDTGDPCDDYEQVPKNTIPTRDFFSAAPVSGPAPLAVLLKWQVGNVSSCTASGDWSGTKATQGEETITIGLSSVFRLRCEGAAGASGAANVKWDAPTQNTDGTSLTNLAGYRLLYGQSASALSQIVQINDPKATSYTIGSLAPALWYFSVKAFNAVNAESALSNTASKQVQPAAGKIWEYEQKVSVTGSTPIPKPPQNLEVVSATAVLHDDGRVEVNVAARLPEAP